MTYKEIYNADTEYQNIIKEFEKAVKELQIRSNQGVYKSDSLVKDAQGIHDNLSIAIQEHHTKRVEETKEIMNQLENQNKAVGYADRPNEVKEFEMRFKLSSDRDLQHIVNDLNTNDLLEVNLLRLELKERGLDEADTKAKHYVMQHNLDGLTDVEQKEYDYRQERLKTYMSVGNRYLIANNELIALDQISKDIQSIAMSGNEAS